MSWVWGNMNLPWEGEIKQILPVDWGYVQKGMGGSDGVREDGVEEGNLR